MFLEWLCSVLDEDIPLWMVVTMISHLGSQISYNEINFGIVIIFFSPMNSHYKCHLHVTDVVKLVIGTC